MRNENTCIMQRDACRVIIGIALIAGKQFSRLQCVAVLCILLQDTHEPMTRHTLIRST